MIDRWIKNKGRTGVFVISGTLPPSDYHGKVRDEWKRIRDEVGNRPVDKQIIEQVQSEADTFIKKHDDLDKKK